MSITPGGSIAQGLDDIASGTTSSEFIGAFNGNFAKILNAIYPIGSIYISTVSTNPATIFGGTWEAIEGKFLLGASNTHSAGSTGGAETVTLTEDKIPSHRHTQDRWTWMVSPLGNTGDRNVPADSTNKGNAKIAGQSTQPAITSYSGGGEAHENMPPYLAVYMWKRVRDPAPAEAEE